MTLDRRGREPERAPDLTTRDDRPVWIGGVTNGDLPVVLGDEVWTVPVDDVEPSAFPCEGPLPVPDTIDMERVYLFEGEPYAEAVVTPTVVVELTPRDGQWRLHGFASSDPGLPFASEERSGSATGVTPPSVRMSASFDLRCSGSLPRRRDGRERLTCRPICPTRKRSLRERRS